MSDYKEIKGKTIQYLGTDPSDTGAEGQVWYNSTAGAFKSVLVSETWSSGAPLVTARKYLGGCGIQTAALAFGGTIPPGTAVSEKYDGTSWTTGPSLGTARHSLGGAGTSTSALAIAGSTPGVSTVVEELTAGTVTRTLTTS